MAAPPRLMPGIRAYPVYFTPAYTMFVYDGGQDDHQVPFYTTICIYGTYRLEWSVGFYGYATRVVEYQESFAVLGFTLADHPTHEVLLAVRYHKLGGVLGYAVRAWRKALGLLGYIAQDNPTSIPAKAVSPFDNCLRPQPLRHPPCLFLEPGVVG
ncbi:hypothetical protein OH77DRAFT_1471155 [Trametes cingulata]|nr:hypothetical protein OH77DRAFT_1594375 [Trametes cingulata]KAI0360823.1 hypothetical protein OH77DRAFT_1471155 [Trametes cingulata]